jgi:hypothetical protein
MAIFDRFWRSEARESGLYLLGHITFSVFPPAFTQENIEREDRIWNSLVRRGTTDAVPPDQMRDLTRLGDKLRETLEKRLEGKPVAEVRVSVRRGTIVLEAAFFLGVYAVVNDYKTLRDSVTQLNEDVRGFLGVPDWRVEADVHTPGPVGREMPNAGLGMDLVSRYAFLYLMVTNLALLVLIVVLTWIVVTAR